MKRRTVVLVLAVLTATNRLSFAHSSNEPFTIDPEHLPQQVVSLTA